MTRCLCSHPIAGHVRYRDRWLCSVIVCGCAEPRPDGRPERHHFDDRHDDLEPRRYADMGAHRVDVWPENEGDV